jgi:hypothetical protein
MNSIQKKFCKVCFDAGREEKDYTSHFVRSTQNMHSKVICPILIGLKCTFCNRIGHTKKYCTELKLKKKRESKLISLKTESTFVALCDSTSESESESESESISVSEKKSQIKTFLPK